MNRNKMFPMFLSLCRMTALMLLCLPAFSQDINWYARLNTENPSRLYALDADAAGNLYTLGTFSGDCDFDFGPGESWMNSGLYSVPYLQKLQHDGSLVWAKQLASGIDTLFMERDVNRAGDSWTLGRFTGVIDINPGPGVFSLDATNGALFVLKLDTDGNFAWARQFNLGNGFWTKPAADDQGNIWLCSSFSGTVDADPGPDAFFISPAPFVSNNMAIIKLDTAGNLHWAGAFGRMIGLASTTDIKGNFYLRAFFGGTVDADPGPGNFSLTDSGSGDDHLNFKLDTDGNFVWAKYTGRSTVSYGALFFGGMEVDAQEQVYMSTQVIGKYDFDPGPGVRMVEAHINDILVQKLDSLGNLVWLDQFDSSLETVLDLKLDAEANCYVTGYVTDSIDMDPGPAQVIAPDNRGGSYDCYILKLDSAGAFGWVVRYGGKGGEYGTFVSVDGAGRVTAGGPASGEVIDFGDLPGDDFLLPTQDTSNFAFFVQVGQNAHYNGVVYEDLNNNQLQDPGEPGFPNAVLEAKNNRRFTSTNAAGRYVFRTDIGGDTLRIAHPRPYWTVAPDFALPDTAHLTNDFVIATPANVQDVLLTASSDAFRPGFNAHISIDVRNLGTATIDSVRVAVDSFFANPSLIPLVLLPNPSVETPEHLEWKVFDLAPGAHTVIRLILKTPDTTTVGTPINIPVQAFLPSDPDPTNNNARIQTVVVASFDPNDKQVYPEIIPASQVSDTRLQYLIRFQNTGTLPADFVILRDTLPATVDIGSLEVLGASHPFSWRLRDAGILEIRFDGINLPDSSSNPEASQGFAAFRLRPLSTLEPGDSVINRAGIYFDYNAPVITRAAVSVVTEISSASNPSTSQDFPFLLAPNPANSRTAVRVEWPANESGGTVTIIDLQGQVLQRHPLAPGTERINVRVLSKGLYVVQLQLGSMTSARLLLIE